MSSVFTMSPLEAALLIAGFIAGPLVLLWLSGLRFIPHDRVGVVEKLWSVSGSLSGGRIIALQGEAGVQAAILRGGIHWLYTPLQYRIRKVPLVVIAANRIGYVYARDGQPLSPTQTLARVAECNNFQDARAFLLNEGQRGRQRAILREGVYANNLAQFVVLTEDAVLSDSLRDDEAARYETFQTQLRELDAFRPVVIGAGAGAGGLAPGQGRPEPEGSDYIGVLTVHDGPPIESTEIIAPEVKAAEGKDHDYFQDPERFLELGGRRGRQLQVLTDGTFFINRWFATVEICRKMIIPIGYVGVVVSFHGRTGEDVTGDGFRYGEQVEPGRRGVWKRALPPGKYALNPFAMTVELVPTVNFVLRWITGQVEAHQYDKDLRSIDIITADGYEPKLPLSLVLHIDYEKAPRVVQRFGDVKRLISQTLDPILSAYFRDVAQSTQMLDLLTHREEIQRRATEELGRRFQEYDITCVAVLIGRPETDGAHTTDEDPIEQLFDQLRQRRLAEEQLGTFDKQRQAAMKLVELNQAKAKAEKQTELTEAQINVDIAGHRGEARLAEARRLSERNVVLADGRSRARELIGKGESSRIGQIGAAEAAVSRQTVAALGDPRLFALSQISAALAESRQPLVPEHLMVMGQSEASSAPQAGLIGQLVAMLLAERVGMQEEAATRSPVELAPAPAPEVAEKPAAVPTTQR